MFNATKVQLFKLKHPHSLAVSDPVLEIPQGFANLITIGRLIFASAKFSGKNSPDLAQV